MAGAPAKFMASSGWALVTGANRGLGLETVILLARKGKRVLAGVRTSKAGAETVAAVREAVPGAVIEFVLLDTSSTESINAAVQDVAKRFGRTVDVLINNAGINVLGWDVDGLETTLRTNVDGPVLLTRALAEHLAPVDSEAGALVVMVSSFLGQRFRQDQHYVPQLLAASTVEEVRKKAGVWRESEVQAGLMGSGSYHLSKAILNRDVELLAQDEQLRQARVAVVAVCPGWCRTDMGSQRAPRSALQGAESVARWLERYEPRLNGLFFQDDLLLAL